MKTKQINKLRQNSFVLEDSPQRLLGLSDTEMAMIDLRLRLVHALRSARKAKRWSQTRLADEMGSSQSRVAKIETGDSSVSLDLVVRGLIAMGMTAGDVGHELIATGV